MNLNLTKLNTVQLFPKLQCNAQRKKILLYNFTIVPFIYNIQKVCEPLNLVKLILIQILHFSKLKKFILILLYLYIPKYYEKYSLSIEIFHLAARVLYNDIIILFVW